MAAAYVEFAITVALQCRLVGEPKDYKTWFEKEGSPFKTFNQRIVAGRAVGLYGDELEKDLHILRDIRNQFAHTFPSLDFTNRHILAECRKLKFDFSEAVENHDQMSEGRSRYVGGCNVIARILFGAAAACETISEVRGDDILALFERLKTHA
jgi:hypothetical protein